MESPVPTAPDPSPFAAHERALGIITTATVLALLYFARGVLVPITLAVILSLLIAPVVRLSFGGALQICLDLHRTPVK